MSHMVESEVEEAALSYFAELKYEVLHGPDIAPDTLTAERADYGEVLLLRRLRTALAQINPAISADAIDDAIRKVTAAAGHSPSVVQNNRHFHRMLVEGVDVEYRREDGSIAGGKVALVDFEQIDNNDFLAVNQFTVLEQRDKARRADIVVFVNGLPLGIIELKNAADENATIREAFNQIQTYKRDIPSLFAYNELAILSDGLEARAGTLTADWGRFSPWRTVEGKDLAPKGSLELETLIRGIFEKRRLLDLIRYFVVFEDDGKSIAKKLAAYHQYHAVNKAVDCTIRAAGAGGDQRAGVVWHTQGSGKSLSMAFYAGKIIQHPAMANPTLVVLTDRNDLDDQLIGTFAACKELFRQTPVQAESREQIKAMLRVASGGVVFTTIQKFLPDDPGGQYPQLSDRRNIIVIADEAHRSQYGFGSRVVRTEDAAYLTYGLAKHLRDALPHASFIGFTGTPIEQNDRSTPAVFGDYIDVYDVLRAVEDKATVPIYYEGRLAKLELKEAEKPKLDPEFEEVTEGEEVAKKEKLKSKWARLEAMVGTEKRLKLIAQDLVNHFEARLETLEGKGMIVCMSRRICVDLYNAIIQLRPEWHSDEDGKGQIKVVMTGSADDPENVRAKLRVMVKRILKRYGYPPDKQKKATDLILEQAENIARDWAA